MLPRSARLRRPAEFDAVFRRGVRAGSGTVVVHMYRPDVNPPEQTRVGFVVSKKVGNAVVRNRVKRRLRHAVRELPTATAVDVVVRALPAAADENQPLIEDLAGCWQRAERKVAAC